ncbi:MAG: M67 family metallopeptidase [Candidatus Freyarchaeum deiterrae]
MLTIPRIRKIVLQNEHVEMMLEEVKKEYPKEACGVILGQLRAGIARVQELVFTKNIADESSVRFVMDPEEQYKILVHAEEENKKLVGIFHSHPTAAKPSGIDKPFMEINPVVWVIVGTLGDRTDIAAYQWFMNTINPVEIAVKNLKGSKKK